MPSPIIYHIDVNSAFLSWEAAHQLEQNPDALDIRTIASAIGGNEEMRHGIVLAKSPIAKKYGVVTGEPLVHARRKCPGLVTFPPNFELYVKRSNEFMALLREYAPEVEAYSIDEAFCDMTGTKSLYGDPVDFAHKLKDKIRTELGFTVNIGISSNRILAKMASDFEKPDKVHTLFPEELPEKFWPLPIEDLFFVGKSTAKKLRSFGIHTIGALANSDQNTIISLLKSHGDTIWHYANGIETTELTHEAPMNKGYGNSLTIHYDVTDADSAKKVLLSLCETVGARIRDAGAYISVVQIQIVDSEFHQRCHQTTLPSSTNITEKIYDAACSLFDSLWDHSPIRLLGVYTSKATTESYEQYSLFDTEKNERLSKLNFAVDSIRKRYGEDSVKRACFVETAAEDKFSAGTVPKSRDNSSLHQPPKVDHMAGGLNKAKRTSRP